jgi:hypothetical protein
MLNCEQNDIELAVAAVARAELLELSLWFPTALLSPVMPSLSGAFKVDEDAKATQIDAGEPAKTMQIEASLDPK